MAGRDVFDAAHRSLSYAHKTGSSLCAPFLDVLPVEGASVSILGGSLSQSTVCSTDSTASRLDELQFDLGEGPCWDALASHRPVLQGEFRDNGHRAWPVLSEAMRNDSNTSRVGAVFAFPLSVGTMDVGAIDLYLTRPGHLDRREVEDATALADVAAWQVLRRILSEHQELDDGTSLSYSRREIHQATGMILAQLNVSIEDAELYLRAHAFSTGRSVSEVANDVVERRLDFSDAAEDGK
jgi:hypothetical protein